MANKMKEIIKYAIEYGYADEMSDIYGMDKKAFMGALLKGVGSYALKGIGKAISASPITQGVKAVGGKALKIAPAAFATSATLGTGKNIMPGKIMSSLPNPMQGMPKMPKIPGMQ